MSLSIKIDINLTLTSWYRLIKICALIEDRGADLMLQNKQCGKIYKHKIHIFVLYHHPSNCIVNSDILNTL
jgi:hypothetical protein